MARLLGIQRTQWIKYENGDSAPGAEILTRICRVHACSADWLLGIDRGSSSTIVHGDGNVVGSPGATVVTSAAPSPACARCRVKKELETLKKKLAGLI